MVSRRRFLLGLGAGLAASAVPSAVRGAATSKRPNVVFILADDLGWRDTSLYGSTFLETPNVDRLAGRGMMFTNAYAANPLCSPTRASIMTGLWPARIGITAPACHLRHEQFEASVQPSAPPTEKLLNCGTATRLNTTYYTLAEALKDAGYRTGHFGKWHLGHEPYDPLNHGFDVDIPHWPGPGPAGAYVAPWRFPDFKPRTEKEHIEDRMADEAVGFIRANRDRPFFLNYWCFSVHAPHDAKASLVQQFAEKADANAGQRHPVYGAMVKSMDDAVGRLLDGLDEMGLSENTIVFFFSDNGGIHWPSKQCYPDLPVTSNAPLRGGKATIYEGGVREPLLVAWPGTVTPGSRSDEIVQSIDFYPTILDMLGLAPKASQTFDGISIVPALRGGELDREAVFCYFPHQPRIPENRPPSVSVRSGPWKLIRFFHQGEGSAHAYELYNLEEDIGETRDLAAGMPAKVQQLDRLIDGFLAASQAVVPKLNPAYNPRAKSMQGWRVIRGATAVAEDSALVVRTEGRAACLMGAAPEATGEVTVEVRMRADVDGPIRLLWNRKGEGVFPPQRAVEAPFVGDNQWREVSGVMTVTGVLNAIRIDPTAAAGTCEIDWIRLRDSEGTVLKTWDF